MNYEKLLAKIEDNFDLDSVNGQYKDAIKAVVELHKPNEFNDCCNGCDGDLPCLTIQAIEKELK